MTFLTPNRAGVGNQMLGDGETPTRFLRTPEAGRLLGLSGRTLEKHRTYGTGPRYRKIGGRVVYAVVDLQTWADIGLRTSTSDGRGAPQAAKPKL